MSKELMEEFAKKAMSYLQTVEAFTKTEVPAFINEILQYKMYYEGVMVAVGLLLILISTLVYLKFNKKDEDGKSMLQPYTGDHANHYDFDIVGFSCLFSGIPIICGLCMTISHTLKVIMITVAPRLYLLEYFKSL